MDTPSPHAAFDSRRHDSRPTRSRKGRSSFVVTTRGASQIVGSWYGTPVPRADCVESVPALAEVLTGLGRLKSGVVGVKASDVLTITNALYGDVLEPLIGTDVMAWATITPARTGVRHDTNEDGTPDYSDWASADECMTARHRSHLLAELPHGAMLAGIKASDLTDEREHAGSLKAWPTRYKIKRVHGRRIGDPTDRHELLANGYHWTGRDHLTSPSDDSERVFVGHKLTARPAPRNGTSTRGKRTRQTVKRRTVAEVVAPDFATLCERFVTVERGQRITWSVGPMSGTFTRAADGRYSVGLNGAPLVKSVRTMDAVRIKLERAA